MQAKATIVPVEPPPLIFAGFPASSWAFAVRTWLACLLALYASFWLQLESPSSAAITVAILALPTRGQGMEKAGFRLLATVIGVAASIAIAGFFSQTDGLLLAVFSVWVGICVFAVGMLDGNQAYAAALCCITVALIAIQQIDSPQQVFPTGVARGAALAIGVLATSLINDVLAAPNYHPVLLGRLDALHRQVKEYLQRAVCGETTAATTAAGLLRDIVSLRPEVASLATESSSGTARSAAARSAMVNLVSELHLARALTVLPVHAGGQNGDPSHLMQICRNWLSAELARKDDDVLGNLDALQAGRHPPRQWRAPLYRSRRIATESGVRAAVYFAFAALFFVVTGWPTTELCLSLVAVIIGLSSTAPDPRMFTKVAVVATPIACLLAGILKYFVFNGVSEFQLLAIGLAPVVIGLSLLISLPNRLLSSLGRLTLVFTLAILAPTNPQSYDPNVFVITCLLSCLASILAFLAQLIVPPLSSERRLDLLLRETHRDVGHPNARRFQHLAPEEANFRDATRIDQIVAAAGAAATGRGTIDDAMHCFDRSATLRRCSAELEKLTPGPLAEAVDAARTALTRHEANAILAAAQSLRDGAARHQVSADSACAVLMLASFVFGSSSSASIEKKQP
jgi:uncharacterized membrane protein YccC